MAAVFAPLLALMGMPVRAQPVTSPSPDSVAVTVYRAPGRSADQELNVSWLTGYALVTEKRRVVLPAGRAVVRFEGVAGGILPESAIVTGLPQGVREKNLDADLLSPRSLYDRSYGRPVILRRTVGEGIVEEEAIIRSGPQGAAILQTRDGFLAADCVYGEDETIVYPSVPEGLSAKPTLSIEVDSPVASTVELTLSYLAWGFDWQANYVATLRPGAKTVDLFAWLTLASNDVTSFPQAETMVVAGNIRRNGGRGYKTPSATQLVMRCAIRPGPVRYGSDAAADLGTFPAMMAPPAPPAPPAPAAARAEVVVTGARMARQEELGDLKLYRVPHPTTVAANSQKQVALLQRDSVPVDIVYRARVYDGEATPARILLRAQNREAGGLGLALPAGKVAVFQPRDGSPVLVGTGSLADKAVGEEVEVEIADATQLSVSATTTARDERSREHLVKLANASPFAVRAEVEFWDPDVARRSGASERLGRKNGRDIWRVEVPANGTRELRYRLATSAD